MDCDKFEDVMLDELYGELDELTSAAAKRHLAGCARCSALLAGLKATRRVLTLPTPSPSEGFEDRLLAAVREAETRAKPAHGMAELISLAGRWAMRPQTAMAAVFLLMVTTTSIVFTRRAPRSGTEAAPASFTVTENGTPAASAAAPLAQADEIALDPRAAAAAHGPAGPAARAAAPAAPATKTADGILQPAPSAEGALATTEERRLDDREKEPYAVAHSSKRGAPSGLGSIGGGGLANSQAADISPPPAPPPPAAAPGFAVAPPPKDDGTGGALAAARADRDSGGGCATAAPELDAVAASAWGTQAGYEATFEGAQCYARLGQSEAARSRFTRLLTVPAYASRAQAGINATLMVAAKARAVSPKASAPAQASPAAAATPAAPPPLKK